MDMNFKRRAKEISIAKEIAIASRLATVVTTDITDAREKLAQQIDVARDRHALDSAATERVMGYLEREIDRVTRS